jgi:hypothetical protein
MIVWHGPHFAIEDQQAVYDQLLRALKGSHCRWRSAIKLNVAVSEGEKLEQIGKAMMLAWGRIKKAQARMWGDRMTIGEGLLEGRRWAMQMAGTNKPEGKSDVTAYSEWLKRYRVDDMDKSDRAKLLQLMEERPGVEEWRATLTDYERRNLNNPTIAWRKWTLATRVKKPTRSAGVSATEHGRAQATLEQKQARIEELEEELTSARPGLPPLNWHRAMRFLIDELPYVGADAGPADWPSEFADMVRQISVGRGVELEELEELELSISRSRAAAAVVKEEEPTLAAGEAHRGRAGVAGCPRFRDEPDAVAAESANSSARRTCG